MAGQQIAQYFAKVGLIVENKEFAKVDKALKDVEAQLAKVVGGSTKETKAKKESTAAVEKKAKAVAKETKATFDLAKAQEKQRNILKKADDEALKRANAFLAIEKKLNNARPKFNSPSQKQIAANRSAFFSRATASDIRTGQGLQYRLGTQADAKIRQMLAGQNALLASRSAVVSPVANNKVFEELQLRLASKLKTPRHLSENQINRNRAAFFSSARILETKTGQGLQYRLGGQVAKIQQATQREQEQAAVKNQRQARKVGDTVEKGLRDLDREIQRAFSPVQNATARRNARLAGQRGTTPPASRTGGGGSSGGNGGGGGRSSASYSRANYLHAGGGAGAIARYGLQSLPFIGGVYGIGQLNRSNQELISGQLTTQAVLAAKGYSTQEGIQANQWLMNMADNVGFNYIQALPDYNQFLSNALGAGLGVGQSQEIFQGFSEYQTAMGVTPARRKLVQNALSQMLGKGILSMEEVRRQMAESMPGTMDVFAESYAEMTGSGLQGQEALAKFYEDIAKGSIESAKILPIVARLLSERAAPKLDVMKQSSIAEQARAENAQTRLLESFSKAGGESGFARLWKGLTSALETSNSAASALGRTFESAALQAEKLLAWPESFSRALSGQDSQVARWLGFDKTEQLKEDWSSIKTTLEDIFSMEYPSWLPSMESITRELQTILETISRIARFKSEVGLVMDQIQSDAMDRYSTNPTLGKVVGTAQSGWFGLKSTLGVAGDFFGTNVSRAAGHIPFMDAHPLSGKMQSFWGGFGNADPVASYWMERNPSDSYDSEAGWRDQQQAMAQESMLNSIITGRYGNKGFEFGNTISGNTFNFEVSLEGGTEGLEDFVNNGLDRRLTTALKYFGRNQ